MSRRAVASVVDSNLLSGKGLRIALTERTGQSLTARWDKQIIELSWEARQRKVISLRELAAESANAGQLVLGLDALGDDRQPERP